MLHWCWSGRGKRRSKRHGVPNQNQFYVCSAVFLILSLCDSRADPILLIEGVQWEGRLLETLGSRGHDPEMINTRWKSVPSSHKWPDRYFSLPVFWYFNWSLAFTSGSLCVNIWVIILGRSGSVLPWNQFAGLFGRLRNDLQFATVFLLQPLASLITSLDPSKGLSLGPLL